MVMTIQSALDPTDRMAAAVSFAAMAGEVTLRHFRSDGLTVDRKQDKSPVTVADREAEQLLRKLILESFPGDGIVGEEFGEHPGTSGYCWILDPIDGTKSFIHGVPLYTTLIGLLEIGDRPIDQGTPVGGVIHAPAVNETVWATLGGGAWHSHGNADVKPCRVSATKVLSESLLVTSEVETFADGRPTDQTDIFLALQSATRLVRTWGDGYGYMMVATGRAEVAIDPKMNLWDAAALLPVIVEAGGHFIDWNGNPTVHAGEAIATNGFVTDEVLAITRG